MYCTHCGCHMEEGTTRCPNCGQPVRSKATTTKNQSNFGWGVLGFFFPLVGLILFLVWRKEQRPKSNASGIGALVGECMGVVLAIFTAIIIFILAGFGLLLGQGNYEMGYEDGYWEGYSDGYLHGGGPGAGFDTSSMDPWFQDPSNWQTSNGRYDYPEPPDPSNAKFYNSTDGTLKFVKLMSGNMLYDAQTNQIIIYTTKGVYCYDADRGVKLFGNTYSIDVQCASVYDGKLAIGFGSGRQFNVMDLQTYQEETYYTSYDVYEIAISDGIVAYADGNQWCKVSVYNLVDGSSASLYDNYYYPAIAINHQDNVLYIVERRLSSCDLFYVNLSTLSVKKVYDDYYYNYGDVFYDGTYVHAFGNLYHATTGNMVALGQTLHFETDLPMYSIMCIDDGKALVTTSNCQTALCDLESRQVLYTMDLYATRIHALGNGRYVAVCGNTGYYALIDLGKLA